MVRNPATMESSNYYDDPTSCGSASRQPANLGQMKRNLTLDLNTANSRQAGQNKKPKASAAAMVPASLGSGITPLLSSPDLLKLNSPDLEKLICDHHTTEGLITSVPTPISQIYFNKVTEEQEQFSRGFMEALNDLNNSDSSQDAGGAQGATYTNLEPPSSVQSTESSGLLSISGPSSVQIKDEPQTVPSVSSSPPMSPIDMESQERIKLERKRQRNRVAASKCRKRKLERISKLEDKVRILKGENSELSLVVNRLKEHVCRLKEQVMDHVHSGCQIMQGPQAF